MPLRSLEYIQKVKPETNGVEERTEVKSNAIDRQCNKIIVEHFSNLENKGDIQRQGV